MLMTSIVIFSLVFILGLTLGAGVIWYVLRRRQAPRTKEPADKNAATGLTFRWKYISLPAVILLLSIVLVAIFYPQLSDEVAWRFDFDGSPKGWLNRGMLALLMLLPQFFLVLGALATTWGMTKLGRSVGQIEGPVKPERLIPVMSNMIALPQIVLAFVMLDVFIYNVFNNHLMPIWLFVLIIMVLAGIILTFFFITTFRRSRSAKQ